MNYGPVLELCTVYLVQAFAHHSVDAKPQQHLPNMKLSHSSHAVPSDSTRHPCTTSMQFQRSFLASPTPPSRRPGATTTPPTRSPSATATQQQFKPRASPPRQSNAANHLPAQPPCSSHAAPTHWHAAPTLLPSSAPTPSLRCPMPPLKLN